MAYSHIPEPALGLKFSRTSPAGGTRFSFALRNPDHLAVDRAVSSRDVSYEGQVWKIVCKRQNSGKFGMELELVLQNTDPCLTCRVDFTVSILRRGMGATPGPICNVRNRDFTKLDPCHGEPDMILFQALVNQDEGYFSSISPWLELELVMGKCVSMFEIRDAQIRPVDNGIARVATFNISDCQLCVYFDMNKPHKRKICIQGQSLLHNQEHQDYSLKLDCTITISDTVIMSKKLNPIHVQPFGKDIPCVISEPAPESKGIVTVRIDVVSFQLATNVFLALPTKAGIKGSQRSLKDPLGNSWKMYVQKQNGKIYVKMSLLELCAFSRRNLSHEDFTAWLQWRAWIVPRRMRTAPVPFNDGNDLSESFFKGTSSLLEYTMKSSLELTQEYGGHSNPFRHGKDFNLIAVRIEYINLQPSVLVPDGKFLVDCESTNMILRNELDQLRLDLINEQNKFIEYQKACKEFEQQKEKIQDLEMKKLATRGSECETSNSAGPEPYSLRLQEDILPSRNGSVRSSVVSEGHRRIITTRSSIQGEIERETTRMELIRKLIKKLETESNSRPSSCRPRTPDDIITAKRLDEVASKLGADWKRLGRQQLGLQQSDIEQCMADNPFSVHEQIFQMLYKWRCREGHRATEGALLAKLKEAKVDWGAISLFHYLSE